ncbi:helix-turn-helix domain-containing protein [Paenarthrobacter sp. RAF9]
MTEKQRSLVDQRRSTTEGRLGMAAAKLALETARLLSLAFSARKDLDQRRIAEMIGVSEGRVSQVLNGDGNVHIATLAKYMNALGYELELLAKPIVAEARPLRMKSRRREGRAAAAGKRVLTYNYQMTTLRDSGVGKEVIQLPGYAGEAPPIPMSMPEIMVGQSTIVASVEPIVPSSVSDEVRQRANRVLAKAK